MSTRVGMLSTTTIVMLMLVYSPSSLLAFNEQTNQAINSLAVLYPNMSIAQRAQYDQMTSNSANDTDDSMMSKIERFVDNLGDNLKDAYEGIKHKLELAMSSADLVVQGGERIYKKVEHGVNSTYQNVKSKYDFLRGFFIPADYDDFTPAPTQYTQRPAFSATTRPPQG